jgi:hypothetical protein
LVFCTKTNLATLLREPLPDPDLFLSVYFCKEQLFICSVRWKARMDIEVGELAKQTRAQSYKNCKKLFKPAGRGDS